MFMTVTVVNFLPESALLVFVEVLALLAPEEQAAVMRQAAVTAAIAILDLVEVIIRLVPSLLVSAGKQG
jgi:hypothetical protein